jgi:hypothetical protein
MNGMDWMEWERKEKGQLNAVEITYRRAGKEFGKPRKFRK